MMKPISCSLIALCLLATPAVAAPNVHKAKKAHKAAWADIPTVYIYKPTETAPLVQATLYQEPHVSQTTPLTWSGSWIGASDQPYSPLINESYARADRVTRLDQQRLQTQLAGKAWQKAALATEYRLLPPEAGKQRISPFVVGGVSLTSIDAPSYATVDKSQNDTLARGWRYGAGVAYSWSTALDVKLGYQASSMPAMTPVQTADADNGEWRTQIMDISVAYRF